MVPNLGWEVNQEGFLEKPEPVFKEEQVFAGRPRWEWGWRETLGLIGKRSALGLVGGTLWRAMSLGLGYRHIQEPVSDVVEGSLFVGNWKSSLLRYFSTQKIYNGVRPKALCQRRAVGSLDPGGPAFSSASTISSALHDKTQASHWYQPGPAHTTALLFSPGLLTDPPESEGIQDKWLRGWS